jgi:hypothetical protein
VQSVLTHDLSSVYLTQKNNKLFVKPVSLVVFVVYREVFNDQKKKLGHIVADYQQEANKIEKSVKCPGFINKIYISVCFHF